MKDFLKTTMIQHV